jgi:hypothetical protein
LRRIILATNPDSASPTSNAASKARLNFVLIPKTVSPVWRLGEKRPGAKVFSQKKKSLLFLKKRSKKTFIPALWRL